MKYWIEVLITQTYFNKDLLLHTEYSWLSFKFQWI